MKKSKFSEAQIVRILKKVEVGAKVAETCTGVIAKTINDPIAYSAAARPSPRP